VKPRKEDDEKRRIRLYDTQLQSAKMRGYGKKILAGEKRSGNVRT
jgi:hypothetical protein